MALSPDDRLAIQEHVAAYARGVDARDYDRLGTLFHEDAVLVYGNARLQGREAIVRGFRTIERYDATHHLVGLPSLEGGSEEAHGVTPCLARHRYEKDGTPRIFTMAIRYRDRFTKKEDSWRFSERLLVVDWEEDRAFEPR